MDAVRELEAEVALIRPQTDLAVRATEPTDEEKWDAQLARDISAFLPPVVAKASPFEYDGPHPPIHNRFETTAAATFSNTPFCVGPTDRIASFFTPTSIGLTQEELALRKKRAEANAGKIRISGWSRYLLSQHELTASQNDDSLLPLNPHYSGSVFPPTIEQLQSIQRYHEYLERGVAPESLARHKENWLRNVLALVPPVGPNGSHAEFEDEVITELVGEMYEEYQQAMSTNILNYVLKLESEKQRLRVKRLPPPATAYTFRDVFPVPPTSYASSIDDAYAFLDRYLFCNHRIMVRLLALWQRFQSCLLVVRVDTDLAIETPMEIDEFARLQQVQRQETVAKMTDEWFQEVMKIFFEDDAAHRAKRAGASSDPDNAVLADSLAASDFNPPTQGSTDPDDLLTEFHSRAFFYSVRSLITTQLRSIVESSIREFVNMFQTIGEGLPTIEQGRQAGLLRPDTVYGSSGGPSAAGATAADLETAVNAPIRKTPVVKRGMVQPAVTPAKPAELVQELPPLKLTQMMDIGVTKLPLIKVRLGAKKEWPRAMYTPSMQDIEAVVLNLHDEYSLSLNCFKEVHEELGRHGKQKDEDTGVRMTVAREEDIHVTVGRDALHATIQRNDIPAKRLAALYQPYMVLLHEQGAAALAKFLKTDHSLPDSHAEIQRYLSLAEEIRNVTPDEVVLNLVAVSTEDVKKALSGRAVEFASLICRKIASDTREISSFINTSYDEIVYKVSQKPTETDALVKLENYFLHEVSLEQGKLVQDIRNFQRMWHFLVEHDHLLPKDDVFWLSTSYHWPTNVQKTLEAGGEYMIREKARAEEALRRRVDDFNLQLDRWKREVDNFAKCNFRDSMGDYAKKIKNIKEHLKGTLPLITDINTEEDMLGWEPTAFPMVREVADQLEPYDQLCTITGDFDTSYKSWMTGIVVDLNAEEIEEKVLSMWRTMYKIQKNFPEEEISMYGLPTGPRTAASTILGKLDDFKKHLPVLAVMCNPGYRDRHYAEISEIVGFPLSTESTMSLESVLRHNLSLHLEKLSSISEMATKEYSLEKALDKMLADWEEIDFEILPHRASGTYILGSGGIDEVQQMLDDHIVKTQTMFNSAASAPSSRACATGSHSSSRCATRSRRG